MSDLPHIVDLFCGCGGFGLGAEQAGFKTIAAVDVDSTLQSSYKYNFPKTRVVNGDLSTMDQDSWRLILNDQSVDGVIGGPPCQGFSRMGVNDPCDPRRSLLTDFFRHVNIIQPKFFVMENVEGLLDSHNIKGLEAAIGIVDKRYTILKPLTIDASEYGVPTKRRRVIVVGYDPAFFNKELTHHDFDAPHTKVSVKDAIKDLPSPLTENANTKHFGWKSYRKTKDLSSYARKMRKAPAKHLGNDDARKKLRQGITSGHFNTIHTDKVKARYDALEMGKTDKTSKSKRLEWNGFCPTLRAGTGADKGSHQATRPIHPEEARVITVREAARLQGFPDWFCFHPAKWHSFRMIGNSVSPVVSKYILSAIRKEMRELPKDMFIERGIDFGKSCG